MDFSEIATALLKYFILWSLIPIGLLTFGQIFLSKKFKNRTALLLSLPLNFVFTTIYFFAMFHAFQFNMYFSILVELYLLAIHMAVKTVERNARTVQRETNSS